MIAPGILSVETRTADGKAGVIIGSRSALAIDAGIDAAEGAQVGAAARDAGRAADLLLFTHGHGDHVLGGGALRDAVVFAHADAERHIRAQIPTWAAAANVSPEELASRLAFPVVTFTGELALDLGGRHVRVLETPGHAPGAVCAYVPDAGVLFGGDTVVTGIPPVFRDGDSRTLQRTLCELAGLGAEVLVPGHGAVVIGADRVREAILWAADYLARVRERVSGALGRSDAETIVRTAAPYEALIGDRLPPDRHRMAWRHEQTVRYMIAELGSGSPT